MNFPSLPSSPILHPSSLNQGLNQQRNYMETYGPILHQATVSAKAFLLSLASATRSLPSFKSIILTTPTVFRVYIPTSLLPMTLVPVLGWSKRCCSYRRRNIGRHRRLESWWSQSSGGKIQIIAFHLCIRQSFGSFVPFLINCIFTPLLKVYIFATLTVNLKKH